MENKKISTEHLLRTLLRYVLPNMLSMAGLSIYILADTIFVANGVGKDGLVALNLVIPAYSVINGIGMLLGIGGGTMFSISTGRGEAKKGNNFFSMVFLVGLVLGVIITLCGLFFPTQIAQLLGAEGKFIPLATDYLRILLLFGCPFIVNNILVAFVRNDYAPNLAMTAMLIGSFSNIILDYVFIYPLQMGMAGAALATGIAPVLGIFVSSLHFLRKKNHFHFQLPRFKAKELVRILGAGIPAFVGEVSAGMVILLYNLVLLRIAGDLAVAAYGISANIALVCMSIFNGVAQGMQPVVSVLYGAGQHKSITRVLRASIIIVSGLGVLFYAIVSLFPTQIASFFVDISDATLLGYVTSSLRLLFIGYILVGVNLVLISYCASTSKPKTSFLLSSLRGFVLLIPLVFLLSQLFGVTGVWITIPIAEVIVLILAVFLLRKAKNKTAIS